MDAGSVRRKSKPVPSVDWFEEFYTKPPTKFPHAVSYKGEIIGHFMDADEYGSAINFGQTQVPPGVTKSILAHASKEEALTDLFRKVEAHDFFTKYRGVKHARAARAEKLAEARDRFNEKRDAHQKAKRLATLNKLQRDIEVFHIRYDQFVDECDGDPTSVDVQELTRLSSSIYTRLRQIGHVVARKEAYKKGWDQDA